eukprot:364365-Chlamydomonas_euryale.AAC.13
MVAINLPAPVTHAAQACFDAASAAAQASPLGQAVSGAVGNMQGAAQRLSRPRPGHAARSAGAYGNRRIVVPPRDARFAAILPGDSVAEAVRRWGVTRVRRGWGGGDRQPSSRLTRTGVARWQHARAGQDGWARRAGLRMVAD